MCGISGVFAFNQKGQEFLNYIEQSTLCLAKRGPDASGIFKNENMALGHRRLSIIDTSESSNQPFSDQNNNFTIVFNGEIFNFKSLKKELEELGYSFVTKSDTEVLLQLYIHYKEDCLPKLNGFFAFAIYDHQKNELFIARDRFGIKPLLYYQDENQFIFGSNMTSILAFPIHKSLDKNSLHHYLQLNYCPEPYTILQNVEKLNSGHYRLISASGKIQSKCYYDSNQLIKQKKSKLNYEDAQKKLIATLEESVCKRMIADVPLGTFLSGGIDSSLITALASRNSNQAINTFSIGFKDEPQYDETYYAKLVAKKYKTNHHTFELTNNDLLESFYDFLDQIDEPFADSSALAVNVLCKNTKKHVTVALSGDGADEIFSGYRKHTALYKASKGGFINQSIKTLYPLWKTMPQSRASKFGDTFRKISKYSEGLNLPISERYWRWASILSEKESLELLKINLDTSISEERKSKLVEQLQDNQFNSILLSDLNMVLKGDMLKKVDAMSMNNGLEVRVPFLDHQVVEFAFSLVDHYKIDGSKTKKILQDAAKNLLPKELYLRPKHGFEVPLVKWFNSDLKELIHHQLLSESFIKNQNLFNEKAVIQLKNKLGSSFPGDSPATVFALLIFNNWWKKHLS